MSKENPRPRGEPPQSTMAIELDIKVKDTRVRYPGEGGGVKGVAR